MSEHRFFDPAEPDPFFTDPAWYASLDRAPHLEQPEHRHRLEVAAQLVREAIARGAQTVSDLGAGDGGLLSLIASEPVAAWGYDLMPANVDAAVNERHVAVTCADFLLDPVQYGECVVLTEVLEHLIDPHGVLRGLPSSVRFVVASSPNDETWESRYIYHTYGWNMDGYRTMFDGAGWNVLKHEAIPGFQVLLAGRG
ncbi:MAG TPA: methyltransferase domain-containing protein [Acidimicrobiia bacterium]